MGLKLNMSAPSVWQFVAGNGSEPALSNAWGQPRAYAIVPTGAVDGCSHPFGMLKRNYRLLAHTASMHLK